MVKIVRFLSQGELREIEEERVKRIPKIAYQIVCKGEYIHRKCKRLGVRVRD